jgi:amidase
MVRSVTDAAAVLTAISGPDPKDVATATAASHIPAGGFQASLQADGLRGARIGFSPRDRDGLNAESKAIFQKALDDLTAQGAVLVETDKLNSAKNVGLTELGFIFNEFKASLNKYLAEETPATLQHRTLKDIIAYSKTRPDRMKYGTTYLDVSDAQPGVMNPATDAATLAATIAPARAAIDATLLSDNLQAIVAPGVAHANVGAAAGYPTVLVPAGYTNAGKRPTGISFLGTAWSEPALLRFAYAYEQASHRRVPPTVANKSLVNGVC